MRKFGEVVKIETKKNEKATDEFEEKLSSAPYLLQEFDEFEEFEDADNTALSNFFDN